MRPAVVIEPLSKRSWMAGSRSLRLEFGANAAEKWPLQYVSENRDEPV